MKHTTLGILRTCCLVMLALAVGCESAPGRHPKVTKDCPLAPGRPAPEVDLGLESAVHIILPGPDAGAGYVWEIASNNNKVLEQMGRLIVAPGAAGAGPTTSVSFYTLKPGKSVLRFALVQPGQQEAVPAGLCEVTVRVTE